MPGKGHAPEQSLGKSRRVDVANGKGVGQVVKEISVADRTRSASLRAGSTTAGVGGMNPLPSRSRGDAFDAVTHGRREGVWWS